MTQRTVTLTIDDAPVEVPEGSTILDACTQRSIDTPTLCFGETLQPANVCRVCVVELDSRVLVPACSRPVEEGMVVRTDSERVRHSRKMVIEFLASSVDLSTTPAAETTCRATTPSPSATACPRRPTTSSF